MLSLRYSVPAADLRGFISTYYLFQANLPQIVDMTRADLPQLRFMISGNGFYTFGDGSVQQCPPVMLTGSTTAATRFTAQGPLIVFGIGLLPAGWNALVGANAAELTDRVECAEAVLGRSVRELMDVLCHVVLFENMVTAADLMFRSLVQQPREPSMDWFTRITENWLMGALSPSIGSLMEETGLSARQLERLTNRLYGAPPKLLARKYRALRVASRLLLHNDDWQDVIGDAFYDQSHFIREFKRFTGQTPRQFQLNPSPVTRLMMARRQLGPILPPIALES